MKPMQATYTKSNNQSVKGTEWPRPEAGTQAAAISLIIDLGIQDQEPGKRDDGTTFERQPCQQVAIMVDLLDDYHDWGEGLGKKQIRMPLYSNYNKVVTGYNFTIAKQEDGRVTFNPKSKMTKLAIATRTHDQLLQNGHDISVWLGKPVMVEIVEKASNGKLFQSIKNIVGVPKGMPLSKLEAEPLLIDFDNATAETVKFIRKDVREQIMKAHNYHGTQIQRVFTEMGIDSVSQDNGVGKGAQPTPAPVQQPKASTLREHGIDINFEDDGDVPF